MIIADASPVIALAKVDRLSLLKTLYNGAGLSSAVKVEIIDEGRRMGAQGLEPILTAFEEGWMREIIPSPAEQRWTERLKKRSRLGAGEAEAIAIAHHRKELLLIDDKEGRLLARSLALSYVGTAGVLLEAHLRRKLNYDELETILADLQKVIWLGPDVVLAILQKARGKR